MSFSSLPPELVHQIIESTVPHTFHTTTYKDRQNALCRLSLVSRQFRSIAQPLLLEIAWIDSDDQLNQIVDDHGKVVTNELVFVVRSSISPDWICVLGGAQNLRSLKLRSHGVKVIDVGVLSLCKNLVNLQLSGYDFNASSLGELPSLQSLSLDYTSAPRVPELLDPRRVPALRALGLRSIDQPNELDDLRSTRIEKLLPQLDALCVKVDLHELAKDTLLANFEPRTLVTIYAHDERLSSVAESLSTIQHLRIEVIAPLVGHDRLGAIQALLQICKTDQQSKPRQLRSLYLDPGVRPVSSDTEKTHEEFAKLEEECRETGVDLVFEVPGQNYFFDYYISPEFCRRQRKRREEGQQVER
ncbi:hypothetical protein JCM3765_005047 [Sporobolomyces pararoseus]